MRTKILALGLSLLLTPFVALAFPFGGQANIVRPCYNQAIYVNLGPPRGGPYVWTTGTKTYQYGQPSHVGQWISGLASVPYYCIISIQLVIVWPGTYIMMMGSSGRAAPAFKPTPISPGGGSFGGGGAGGRF